MRPPVVVSRYDRLGDLILSLPALALLKSAGFSQRLLHCAPYAQAIGEWALFNGLCEDLWTGTEDVSAPEKYRETTGLCLHLCRESQRAFKHLSLQKTWAPRTKLWALWSFSHAVAQHRSRVEKSEMEYNLDLVRHFLQKSQLPVPEFVGLPALKVPPAWKSPQVSPDFLAVVSNRGSAHNWPIEQYIVAGLAARAEGKRVHFLVSGLDATQRRADLQRAGVEAKGCEIIGDFGDLRELIRYLAGCGEVLCSSTGPLHIAHAAGVPVTGIYPKVRVQSFKRWRPDGYWHAAPIRLIELES